MFEVFTFEFMQNALYAGVLASIACGLVGTLVVVNRMVFLAGGVAHTAYGGVGLAFFAGWPVMPLTIGFTLATSLLMAGITVHRRSRIDTIVGVFWSAGMALGIILLDLSPGYNVDLMSYLFGSILTVPSFDILVMILLDVLLVSIILFFYKGFLAMSFDEEFARIRGVPVTFFYFLLMAMIAVSVVMIIQVVGLILVIALITIPPYLAQRHSTSLGKMMLIAIFWSTFFCLAGLLIAYYLDFTSGASIIAVATLSFFILFCLDWVFTLKRRILKLNETYNAKG